jgi:hypothetical protein
MLWKEMRTKKGTMRFETQRGKKKRGKKKKEEWLRGE